MKSSDAISLDSILINVVGYISYFVTIYLQLFNEDVISSYEKKYKSKPILSIIDFCYSTHCMICIIVTLIQVVYYRILKQKSYHNQIQQLQKPNGNHSAITFSDLKKFLPIIFRKVDAKFRFLIIFVIAIITFSLYSSLIKKSLPLLLLTKILTMIKLFINTVKYVPQLLLNYKKKSTKGYPFTAIYLDLVGGTASLCQIILDNYFILVDYKNSKTINNLGVGELDPRLNFNLFDFIRKNFAKCGLVLVGFFFDFCFLTQKRLYEKSSNNKRKLIN